MKKFKIKCDNCGEPAAVNVQKVWIKWKYNPKTGKYSNAHELLYDVDSPTGDENFHFCKKCFLKWRNGEI